MNFLLWGVYYPLIKLLSYLFFWLPVLRDRKKFEKKNFTEPLCAPFSQMGIRADHCFEFSSEGEYQQVASLVDDALSLGKRIELVFFSPSVEKAIVELANRHPDQVRYLRYPLLTFSPWRGRSSFTNWCSSSKLTLVRYDLFPEFLIWSKDPSHELKMIWVSFKRDRLKGKKISWFKESFLRSAKTLIYASGPDLEHGRQMGLQGLKYDFRMEQIRRRVAKREDKFKALFPQYSSLKKQMDAYPRDKRLIFGNAWPSDLFLLRDFPADYFLVVVPHQLTPDILAEFRQGMEDIDRTVIDVAGANPIGQGDTFLLNKKGILCELYSDFGMSYVGGGFESSVHSLLEPLVAGSDRLSAGPKNQRSTEFDVAQDMGRVTEVQTPEDFIRWIQEAGKTVSAGPLTEIFDRYAEFRKEVISC